MPEGSSRLRRALVRGGTLVAVAVSVYYLTLGGEYSLFDLRELERSRDRMTASVDSLQAAVDSLRARGDSLESDTLAIERVARERHGFARERERVYRFVDDSAEEGSRAGSRSDAAGNPRR